MTTPRDAELRQSAAMERVRALAMAHGFADDDQAQQSTYEALAASAREERDALIAALVAEYAAVVARRGPWGRTAGMNTMVARALEDGARSALLHVAERLGAADLHARAAEVGAHGAEGEGP